LEQFNAKGFVATSSLVSFFFVCSSCVPSAFSSGFGSMTSSCATSLAAFQHLLCASQAAHADAEEERFHAVTPALHVCMRSQPELTRWALANGLRITRNSNLMVLGAWKAPKPGFVYCPSTELL
jgi:hypothetical protein